MSAHLPKPMRAFAHALTGGACLLLLAGAALAQVSDPADTRWEEAPVQAPPAYDPARLIALEMPRASSIRAGIDPQTIQVGTDGVIRYVVVMRGPAAQTASFEGLRCATGEYRVYARRNSDEAWADTTDEPWRPVFPNAPAPYVKDLARSAFCEGKTPVGSTRAIVNALRRPLGGGQ